MKKILIVLIAGMLVSSISCKKSIDCTAELLISFITHTKNPEDHKIVTFNFDYGGEFNISKIIWDFGDGSSISNTDTTVTHTYENTGSYTVKVTITLDDAKRTGCTSTKEHNLTI
ncbi:MAG: PKD domain-containing protein [Bacteroidetes bacterium]|nr:PKD domain-containing protein [Bacteroidota bacterium]